jgi:transmembrane sensor
MMDNNRIIILSSRKLSGEATPEELEELRLLLEQYPEALEQQKMLQQFWEQHDNINQSVIEESLSKVLAQLNLPVAKPVEEAPETKVKPMWRHVAAAAAVIAILAGAAYFFTSKPVVNNTQPLAAGVIEKQNSKGTKSTIELTDGSKIWLNADSKITYPEEFNGNTREVTLNGEAFFDIAKNPSKPFIIHLAQGTIRVLGTSFNVRAYENEKIVETSVATGKVAFIPTKKTNSTKSDTVFVVPEQKVSYAYTSNTVKTTATISADDKAWTEGRLIFKARTFEQIAVELERNFGKKVVFLSDDIRGYTLTGSFQNNTLDEIVFYLSKTKAFRYKLNNTELLLGNTDIVFP